MHFMLQWLKNTVPEPRAPGSGGAPPWCPDTAATRREIPAPQNPVSPFRRFTPHPRGHRRQRSRVRTALACRFRRLATSIWCTVSQIPWHSSAAASAPASLRFFTILNGMPQSRALLARRIDALGASSYLRDGTLRFLFSGEKPVEAGEQVAGGVGARGGFRGISGREAGPRGGAQTPHR